MRSFHYLPCRIFNLFCRNRMTRNLNVKNCMFCELLQFWKISNTNNGRKNFKLGFNTLLRLEMFAHHNNSVIRNSCLRSNSGKKTTMLIHREYGPSMKQSIHSMTTENCSDCLNGILIECTKEMHYLKLIFKEVNATMKSFSKGKRKDQEILLDWIEWILQ
jgi:hypothetical protein